MSRNEAIERALIDMLNGWKYIRSTHGDLYGVGWDRAQLKAEQALAMPKDAEPIAWLEPETLNSASHSDYVRCRQDEHHGADYADWFPVYTHPPKADAERVELFNRVLNFNADGKADATEEWENLCDDIRAYLQGGA